METRLKQKLSNMFQSCHSKNISDVSHQPFFFPENQHHRQLIDLFSPKPNSFSKPKCYIEKNTKFPANMVHQGPEKMTRKKPHYRKPKKMESFTSDNYYYDWRSSDEENESDDETTLFSSRSFSSDSSASFRKKRAFRKSKRFSSVSDKGTEKSGKLVEDSFAVVKKSSNPYEDFRVSMVEMIVEKNIFGPQELEDLLECFISLNSEEHHRVIFDVFIDIWEVLFSDLV